MEPADTAPRTDAPPPAGDAPESAAERPAGDAPESAAARPAGDDAPAQRVTLGRREGRSPRDMALSLVVLLVPIALLLVFYRVVLSGDAPVTVDPSSAIQEAQAAQVFPVLTANGLSDDWHVSAATFRRAADGATLRIGYVAPDDDAALLVQSSVAPEQLLPAELGKEAKPTASFRADNGAWRQYQTRPGESALVLAEPGRTVVVVGTADQEHLQELASALR